MRFGFTSSGIGRRSLIAIAGAALATSLLMQTPARAEWPERPITLVVCFPAGGGTDTAMRMVNTQLGEAFGKPVIIENRGGAGGNIAISLVARAAPDGYTLLGCSSAFVVNPSLYANATYDPFKDFQPIMVLGAAPNVFVVPAQSEIKTFQDLVAKAKANPGKLNYTSSGVGTTPFLAAELVKLRLGLDIIHIPYAGAGPATQAALAGMVDMYAANLGSLGAQIQAGSLRPIAQTGKERWPDLPDVPTLGDLGLENAESDTFQAMYAPAGTPKPIIDKIVDALNKILAEPDIKEKYWKSGLQVLAEGPEKFKARIAREVPMYREIIEKAGLKIK
ncbi:MAG: tripartite tricarboxylate transporter substrate binding protein [Variibacter sp.]|nr:tripartite tricarboxylate transporter substrate binding protein [Variibacter sp.]